LLLHRRHGQFQALYVVSINCRESATNATGGNIFFESLKIIADVSRPANSLPPMPTSNDSAFLKMLKPTKTSAARFRRRAQDCMEMARLISHRQEAKALRQQAQEYFARAQEIELAIRKAQDGDRTREPTIEEK
jgi:hypothetical protein